jgi:uncharacterized protein YfaS (alpha-2-macroglobulin family)
MPASRPAAAPARAADGPNRTSSTPILDPHSAPVRAGVKGTSMGVLLAATRSSLVALAVVVLALGGCRREPPEAVPVPVVETTADAPFGLASAGSEPFEGRPAVVLGFTQRLASGQRFDDRIRIARADGASVSGSWALADDGVTLRFPYLAADTHYRVTLSGELESADGATLGAAIEKTVYTGPLEPIVGFAGQGNVLPSFESRGLPVIALNVSEVDVEFLRVRERDLPRFLEAYPRNQRLYGWRLGSLARWTESVYSNRFALSGAPNERSVSYLPVRDIRELAEPGLYFAVLRRPGTFDSNYDTAMFFVSDIGLNVRHYRDEILVHTASLETGKPKARVTLSLRNERGEEVASAETDARGLARFAWRFDPRFVLVARHGRDLSLLSFRQPALDLSEFTIDGRPHRPAEIFPWSGRDLYRPGETLRVDALLRDPDGRAMPSQPLFARLNQPDGRTLARLRLEPGELGHYALTRAIPADAPTGRWQIGFSTDPADERPAHVFRFRVEEFLPERIKLDFDSPAARIAPGEALPLRVRADYLYGAPAAGLRFTAKLAVANATEPLPQLKGFVFGDALQELPTAPVDVVDTTLERDGTLEAEVPVLEGVRLTGPVTVAVQGSVFETGGRAISRNLVRTVWPADALVGARPLFDLADGAPYDDRARFELVRADADGNRVAGSGLEASLIREHRDWHWTFDPQTGWRADFTRRFETVATRRVDVPAGGVAPLEFDVEWGEYRLEVTDPATGLAFRLPFRAGWGWDEDAGDAPRPDRVRIALDKPAYRGGDTIVATLTPPHEGPALVLLESDRVLWETTIEARAGATVRIPFDAAWERHDVYLTVLSFRPGSSREGMTPKRAVGIAHVPLDRSDRTLAVTLAAPDTMRPQRNLTVDIDAPALAGRAARVRVSAVDLGVLNITRFALPDAAAWFFARRAYGVEARDLYARVVESLAGQKARLRYGGDMALPTLPGSRRPNAVVETVDLLAETVAIGADGKARVELPVPDFNGTLKVRALVYGEDRYGAAEVETVVRAPLVAEASTPRVLAPGDRSRLTLDLTNLSGRDGEFTLSVTASGPVAVQAAPSRIAIAQGERRTVEIPLEATGVFGVGELRARVTGPEIEIDRRFRVAVRPAWPEVARASATVIESPAPISPSPALRRGLIPETVTQRLAITTLPPLPYAAAARQLAAYPYGCIEQTTAKAWPLLLGAGDRDRLGIGELAITDPAGARLAIDEARRAAMLDLAIARIGSMQTDSGHFAFWPGEAEAVTTMTPIVTEFLLAAREAGAAVPAEVLDRALERLREDLLAGGNTNWALDHYEHVRLAEMAWAGWVLAKVERAPVGTLRALHDNERGKFVTPLPLVHLGAALKRMGDAARARVAVDEAFSKSFDRPRWLGDYGSETRDLALMLAIARAEGLARPEHEARAIELARRLGGRGEALYLSTQEQVAILRLGQTLASTAPRSFAASIAAGGRVEERTGISTVSRSVGAEELAAGIRVTPSGGMPLYVIEEAAGIPATFEPTSSETLSIRRRYFTPDGRPWTGGRLAEGDLLVVRLDIGSAEPIRDALVVDLVPGGLEVENLNLTDPVAWGSVEIDGIALGDRYARAQPRFEEYRDDRYVAAVELHGGEVTLMYLARAVSPGSFVVPPPFVEDMYRPTLRSIGEAIPARIEVAPPR